MKTIYSLLFLSAIAWGYSCTDKYSEELTMNVPVYMSYNDLRASVAGAPARPLVRPGKIYFKGIHLFIVEYLQGIHIVDVSNPSQPQHTGFIEVPGCVDIAVRDQSLYADSYVDLVAIDISDPTRPKVTERLNDVFPYTLPAPEEEAYPCAEVTKEKGVVVAWEVKRETREIKSRDPSIPVYYIYDKNNYALAESSDAAWNGSSVSFGKSGSMARFGLYDNYLYIADNSQLYIFNTDTPPVPTFIWKQYLQGSAETMFIYDGHMFFGTPSGMMVYNLNQPLQPEYTGTFWHVTSCDPVVVQDGYAYITLRSGTSCDPNAVNRLDVVEVSEDYKKYTLVNSYPMTNPHGLGIDGETLFVCDGADGLKIYDATDKQRVTNHLLAAFPNIQAYDVIP
ncbi:MAG: hypothetical protein LBP98_00510, partial [Tannerella sp.]|nr:hypothetical protein [Tannerella sp.]